MGWPEEVEETALKEVERLRARNLPRVRIYVPCIVGSWWYSSEMDDTRRTRILRRPEVQALVGLRRSAIYAAIASGTFPRPIRLTERAVGWIESEITTWIESRVAERKQGR
jgi:prophage regulatory protein